VDVEHSGGKLGALWRAWAVPAALGVLVVAFAAGSGSVPEIKRVGLHLRWVVLVALLAVLAVLAALRWSRTRRLPNSGLTRFGILALGFLGLAFLSTGWSVAPRLTFERATSLALLFAVAWLLAYIVEDDELGRRRALSGLAGGAVAIALIGVAMLAFDRTAAVQQASSTTPWRYRGFTENPNTISILAGVALPIIAWLALSAKESRARVLWALSALLLLGSVIAAESRGGLLAAAFGVSTVCLAQFGSWRPRFVAVVTIAVVLVGGIELRAAVDPGQAPFVSAIPPAPPLPPVSSGGGAGGGVHHGTGGGVHHIHLTIKTHELPGENSEIGHPLLSRSAASVAGSGRVAEWKGVLKQVEQRPLVGYGFGTEERVFVDRWYYFEGGTAENSYLGMLLQLGMLGTLYLCGLAVLLLAAALRVIRRTSIERHGEVAAELGVLVAAFTLMLIQSYIYSVGNVASATAWLAVFLLGSNVLRKGSDAPA
jgi:hypothetical protein